MKQRAAQPPQDDRWVRRVRELLAEREEGLSSGELARALLAAESIPEALAHRIVRAALEGIEGIALCPDGRWRCVSSSPLALDRESFLCLVPHRTHDGKAIDLGWALVQNRKAVATGSRKLAPHSRPRHLKLPWPGGQCQNLVVFSPRVTGLAVAVRFVRGCGWGAEKIWSVRRLAKGLFPYLRLSRPEQVAEAVGERWLSEGDPRTEALSLANVWLRLLELAEEQGAETLLDLERLVQPARMDFTRFAFGPSRLRTLPRTPGVYVMVDRAGDVIYVGKAKNLAARLPSYFRAPDSLPERDRRIAQAVWDFEVFPLGSELEAILTEHRLIQQHRPALNQQVVVHSRSQWERVRNDWAVVLPSVHRGYAEVFLINRAGGLRQVRCAPEQGGEGPLREAIQRLFFEGGVSGGEEGELVFSWLATRQPWDRVLPASRWSCPEEGARQIAAMIQEVVAERETRWRGRSYPPPDGAGHV
ncbi:MAG: nucleotide excision repair endonuclease [candidate division KSB1 bacterium]|nr:nucleotide excision repair endonuclease [candidate division KSB1 bacterium]